jgi:hypothetical protein
MELVSLAISMMAVNDVGERSLYYCFEITWVPPR